MFLFSCSFSSRYPEEVLRGVEDRAIRTLRTDRLNQLIFALAGKQTELKVAEVTLNDRSQERRAFLTFPNNQYYYLGPLQRLDPDDPVEFILFELSGSRFIAIWIDEAVVKNPSFVTVMRPQQLASDDSMRVLNTGEAVNRVALIYIPESQGPLWNKLVAVRITGRGVTGYAWEKIFEPPLEIEPYFIEVSPP
jgi:hypothetical protein